jgi:hypothetical protein
MSHLEGEDAALGLGLVTNVRVLLAHADHDVLVARTPDDRREDSTGSIVSGESGLAHARAVVNNEGSDVFHGWMDGWWLGSLKMAVMPLASCEERNRPLGSRKQRHTTLSIQI